MTDFDSKKLTELVLYILDKTCGVDFYHAFKILYFAEMKHLAKWGSSIVPDEFCALKYGPVPTHLYDAVKELNNPKMPLSEELSEVAQFAGEDAPNVLLPKREVNLEFLSRSEIEALDESIEENKSLTFGQLMKKSHDNAWDEANHRLNGSNIISPVSMARVLHADEAMLEYIEQQQLIEAALK
ncbi:MAG: SocA family protein [Bacteroides sp.]|nr:SocA family protein [Bacteroides sp.]MBD5376179.1 SocA family protein [Bacteroides sp.]MDE7460717.1 SocA family protein [Paramuribaculum sp.]